MNNVNAKATILIRSLMADMGISEHIIFSSAEGKFTSREVLKALEEDPMKLLLRQMFTGWCLHEASYEQRTETTIEPTRSSEDAMREACGGDQLRAELLCLFAHWSNDILGMAAHYGLALARRQPDGSLVHNDGTVDTLMQGGVLEVVDIPPAPSPDHYWHAGAWCAPEEPEWADGSAMG